MNVNKKTSAKKLLVACGVSIILCITMLIGSTFAWFSDSVANKGNRIQAGDLNAKLYKYEGVDVPEKINPNWTEITNSTNADAIFGADFKNWEPGVEKTIYLAVQNAGSLNFKYNIDLVITDSGLADVLLFNISSSKVTTPLSSTVLATESVSANMKNGVISSAPKGQLDSTEIEYITLKLKMMESAGNSYQTKGFGADIILTASQMQASVTKAYSDAEIVSAKLNDTIILMKNIQLTKNVTLDYCNIDLNKYTLDLGGFSLKIANPSKIGTVDILNGNITNGTLEFAVPFGSATTDATFTSVNIIGAVSKNTLVFDGVTDRTITMLQGRLIAKNDWAVSVSVPATAVGVTIEDKRSSLSTTALSINVETGATNVTIVESSTSALSTIEITGEGASSINREQNNIPAEKQIFTVAGSTITGLTEKGKLLPNLIVPSKINGITITEIGDCAFPASNSKTIDRNNRDSHRGTEIQQKLRKSIILPDTIEKIGNFAFFYNIELTVLNMPKNLKTTGDYSFGGLKALTSAILPEGLTSIGYNSFYGCGVLKNLSSGETNILPSSLKTIYGGAFNYCKAITNITLPAGSVFDGAGHFANCTALTDVNLLNKPTIISDNFFQNCPLTDKSIAGILFDGVTEIGSWAFGNIFNTAGHKIFIPASVLTVRESAFTGTNRNTVIHCGATAKPDGWVENWRTTSGSEPTTLWGQIGAPV